MFFGGGALPQKISYSCIFKISGKLEYVGVCLSFITCWVALLYCWCFRIHQGKYFPRRRVFIIFTWVRGCSSLEWLKNGKWNICSFFRVSVIKLLAWRFKSGQVNKVLVSFGIGESTAVCFLNRMTEFEGVNTVRSSTLIVFRFSETLSWGFPLPFLHWNQ